MDAQAKEDFRSYVAARSPALLRTAYPLTGDRADAEDLLQTALAKTYLSWERIREREAVDGYVRRVMDEHPDLLVAAPAVDRAPCSRPARAAERA